MPDPDEVWREQQHAKFPPSCLGLAIDGVKLPSNADKRRSGTHAELRHEAERMEAAVATMMKAHRARDEHNDPAEDQAKERKKARGAAAVPHASPSYKAQGFTTGGNKYDPLNVSF